jgi:superfamily II DNA or RNA helicase
VEATDAVWWLEARGRSALARAISPRNLDLAQASTLEYEESPSRVDPPGASVRAVLRDRSQAESWGPYRVTLSVPGEPEILEGTCSRCIASFGPCVHVAVLAMDLVGSPELLAAVADGRDAAGAAEAAVQARLARHFERRFPGALAAWTAPGSSETSLEIAASPVSDADAHLARDYGDRGRDFHARAISVVARRIGDRKLLGARELTETGAFGPADRAVLLHVRDRGGGRKAAYASGVHASLLLEAMRKHGRVFAHGFHGLLDFRTSEVRPAIRLCGRSPERAMTAGRAAPFDTLRAFWVPDHGLVEVPFEEATLFAGPFPFVWTKSGAIYRVAVDVDPELVERLAAAPVLPVPPARLKDAGVALLRAAKGKGIVLPASEVFGLPPTETPRFVLRLGGGPLDVEGDLIAVYAKKEISLLTRAQGGAEVGAGRDLEHEDRARALIAEAGLALETSGDGEDAPRLGVTGEAAALFWQRGIVFLRGARDPALEVELSTRLAKVRVGIPVAARVHVALEGEWLKTRLEFGSAELPVELADVRAALARKERWVSLSDGTLARISHSVEALAEEALGVMGPKDAALLPAHQLGRLDRWVEENDGRVDAAAQALRRRLRALAVAPEPDVPAGLTGTLRPYQRAGLAWLQFLQALGAGGILADDMGLGKTITTLAFLLARKEREGQAPSLVVCPTSVASNWVNEAARFTPGLNVMLLHGPSPKARARALHSHRGYDVIVTTYALVRSDIEALASLRFRCVVLDEAQNIKNSETATKRAAGKLEAGMRLALTGTPIENRLRELWSIASFVNPGILGSQRAFETRYERPIAANPKTPLVDELRATVRPFLLRRTKDAVLSDLPPKTELDRSVTLARPDKRVYDALAHTLRESLAHDLEKKDASHVSLAVFTALTRLRQLACDPRLFDKRMAASRSAKREAFLEIVRELVAEGRRALVFSQFVELLTLWRADLDRERIAYEYLDGSTRRRGEVVARFQEGTAPLFLISLKAGGAGLNLTAADTVIHCDPWWNPAVEDQATDRAHRIGQDKPVTVIRLIARGTIEEKMLSLKAKKRELADAMLGGGPAALAGITRDDLALLLGDADDDPETLATGGALTDRLATLHRVLDPEFHVVVLHAQRWLATTGRPHGELATLTEIPEDFAARLARGQPFPCSRTVGDRIRRRVAAW